MGSTALGSKARRSIALLLVLAASLGARAAAAEPFNFVVIMADDLGAKELACYGNTVHRTPNLDRLADEGMRFRTCYATPLCTPTRVLIMTGQYGFRTGYFNFLGRVWAPRPDSPEYDIGSKTTFADVLKAKGWATAAAGKWQLTGRLPALVRDCGFDEYCMWAWLHELPEGVTHGGRFEGPNKPARFWHPAVLRNGEYVETKPDDYGPDLYADFLIDFMRRNRDRPFVAYYPMALTHTPWEPTPDPARPGERTPRGLQSNVEYADRLVGRVVAVVDELGLARRTLVIFTGDNGTQGSGKGRVTELGARVPFIARCPGTVQAGVVSDAVTDLSDVFPTLLDFAGVPLPEGHVTDGKSLAPVLRGEARRHREWVFSSLGTERMLRDERWLLEGSGRFFDCGDRRDHEGYRDVSDSEDPEVLAARARFEKVLESLPGPEGRGGLRQPVRGGGAPPPPAQRDRDGSESRRKETDGAAPR